MKLRPSNAEWDEIDRIRDGILRRRNINELRAYLASGQYEHYTLMDCRDGVAESDLFYYVIRGFTGHDKFLIDAFDAFVDDGSVFRKPYGLLAVLWRAFTYASPMYMIVVTLIPDETWREMTLVVENAIRGTAPDPFGFPAGHFPMLVATCLRWGRSAITLEQAATLRDYQRRPRLAITAQDGYYREPEVEFWREPTTDQDWTHDYTEGLRALLAAARKRACYNDLYSVVLGMLQTNTSPEALREITTFAVPCVHQGILTRLEVVRFIDRMRAAMWRAEERRDERSVSTRVAE